MLKIQIFASQMALWLLKPTCWPVGVMADVSSSLRLLHIGLAVHAWEGTGKA